MNKSTPFNRAAKRLKASYVSVAIFSAAVNLLMLTSPLFMLQIYDRVLTSRSLETLSVLFTLVVGLYAFLGFFQFIRARVLSRSGYKFQLDLATLAKGAWIKGGIGSRSHKAQPVQDLSLVRGFVGSNAPAAFFDLPWVPAFLALVFMLHFWLGILALGGAIVIVTLTLINEALSRKPLRESAPFEMAENQLGQHVHVNADAIVAMGMRQRLISLWNETGNKAMAFSQKAGNISEVISSATKVLRLLLQSAILALGAWLAILQEITPGVMIAASIIAGRALAPIDQVVGSWRNFIRARLAYARLKASLENIADEEKPLKLEPPKGHITVQGLVKMPFLNDPSELASAKPILQNLNFSLEPGDALCVIGPSATGKSSLARLLVGIWMPDKGSVRIDGAAFDQWDEEEIGAHIGYLPQTISLLPGSIKDNICRFDPAATDEDVLEAAAMAGIDKMILAIPGGYDAHIGDGSTVLSGGQSQRLGLARAAYKKPALVVLDEPNSNLDFEGDQALAQCIVALREAGSTVVVMAHRSSAISAVNKVLMLQDGRQKDFGSKEEVLQKVQRMNVVPKAG
ncbi:MAG: type I secretion system permease/ATPase [Lentilitoribacter sp.]